MTHTVWLPLQVGEYRGFLELQSPYPWEFIGHEGWCMCAECQAYLAHTLHVELDRRFRIAGAYCPGVLDKQ